jgi:integrase
MATKIQFSLKVKRTRANKNTAQSIYVRLTDGRKCDVTVKTGEVIEPVYWDYSSGYIRSDVLLDDSDDNEKITERLLKIKTVLDDINLNVINDYRKFDGDKFCRTDVIGAINRVRKGDSSDSIPKDVIGYCEYFLKGIKEGRIKYKGRSYSKNTYKAWHTFYGYLKEYHSEEPFEFADINKTVVDGFTFWMEQHGYMSKTINKAIGCFHALVSYSMQNDKHNNAKALSLFTKKRVIESDKVAEIYLSNEELQALYDMQLSGLKEIVRDVFLVGCYTGQRFSDYSRITKDNFQITPSGTRVIKLVQQKTRKGNTIPILSDNLVTLCNKYHGNIPRISDVILNRYIKDICRELAINIPSLAVKVKSLITMKERNAETAYSKKHDGQMLYERDADGNIYLPRWQRVVSHTARRTCITLMYLSHKYSVAQMMAVSGHTSVKIFMEYVKLSGDEVADDIARDSDGSMF